MLVEFMYNNSINIMTKMSPFIANYDLSTKNLKMKRKSKKLDYKQIRPFEIV